MRSTCFAAVLVPCHGGMLQGFVEKVERGDLVPGHFMGSMGSWFCFWVTIGILDDLLTMVTSENLCKHVGYFIMLWKRFWGMVGGLRFCSNHSIYHLLHPPRLAQFCTRYARYGFQ